MSFQQQFQRGMIRLMAKLPGGLLIRMSGGSPIVMGGRTLDPVMQLMWVQGKRNPPMESLDPKTAKAASSEAFVTLSGPPRPGVGVERKEIPGPGGKLQARLYEAIGAPRPSPLMLYFHQGGCVIGDLDTCDTFCSLLAERGGCRVLSVDYRLAPEHKFPAAPEDAVAAYRWARDHAEELGADPKALAVGGDSAGGGLSAVITHALKKAGEPQPLLQLLIYPWVTAATPMPSNETYADAFPLTAPMMEWFAKYYFNSDADRSDTRVSPLLETDFEGLAPAIIATAGFDPISDEGPAYAEKLRQAGVPVAYTCFEHLTHSFTAMYGTVPAARAALEKIADDVKKALAS